MATIILSFFIIQSAQELNFFLTFTQMNAGFIKPEDCGTFVAVQIISHLHQRIKFSSFNIIMHICSV